MKSLVLFGLAWGEWDFDKRNVAVYWGQNSYGATDNDQTKWEQPLAAVCRDESVDIVNISFLHNLNGHSGERPEINLSKHCWTRFPNSQVLNCS